MKNWITVIATLIFSFGYADVVINEVQSSNDQTCLDENGESPDWIELYNNGEVEVDLAGWGLSDNASKLFKWTFPEGTTIASGGYLRVFADSTKVGNPDVITAKAPNDSSINDDLVAWLDADTALASYGNGGSVSCWDDKSSYGNNATNSVVGFQPKVYADKVNGHAALSFSETAKTQLDFNHLQFGGMTSLSNVTVFIVAKWSGKTPRTSGHGLFGLATTKSASTNIVLQVSSKKLRMDCGLAKNYCIGPVVEPNRWANFGCSIDSERETPRKTLYVGGDKVAFNDSILELPSMSAFDRLMVGRGYLTDGRFFDGDIAEFIMYRRELSPDEYRAVYAYLEDKYRLSQATNLHTSFSLSGSGEDLFLTKAGEVDPCDEISFGAIPCDTSFGRTQEGYAFFTEPTPGTENAEAAYAAPLEKVVFSKERGIYNEPFEVELSAEDPEARIYYTTDHSDPSAENGILYMGPISVTGTTIIRATAVKDGALPYRNITAHSYIFLRDILTQSKPAIAPDIWSDAGSTPGSYGISKDVVYDEETYSQFVEALTKVPIVSITMSDEAMFSPVDGLYTKPSSLKGQEKAASIEWVSGTNIFGVDAGVRIQGNTSHRFTYTPKKSFRVCFRGRYGTGSLTKPVMSDVGYDFADFNSLTFRAENGKSWPSNNGPSHGTNMRDQFARDLQGEISGYQSKGTHVSLFINGLYWGLYNIAERDDSDSAAAKFGGDKRNYNVVSFGPNSRDGNMIPYKDWVAKLATTDMSVKENYLEAIKDIDLDAYVEYMLIKNVLADKDWPHNNWEVAHSPRDGVPYRYFVWDTESAMLEYNLDVLSSSGTPSSLSPQVVHTALKASAEYRMKYADAIQRLVLQEDAPLSSTGLRKRYSEMAETVRPRVFAEAARWGTYRKDHLNGVAYGMADWDKECKAITNSFMVARQPAIMQQFLKHGLYPNTRPATLQIDEGGSAVSMSAEAGTIYYTTDGSDPRVAFEGTVNPAALRYEGESITSEEDAMIKARVLSAEGEWSALTEMPIVGSAPAIVRNEFLLSTNGENWDKDANWSEGYFPNEAGATAVIGVPTEFKKDKGWRNIHINKTNVTVGYLEVTSGGCTNRIDTGKSGNLTFAGKLDAEGVATEAASIVVMDEANPSLLMIDLDAPNKVVLATDLDVVVSNAVGDVEYGGALFKGIWEGNGHNLAKSGVGRLTLDVANTPETAFGKIQIAEGSIDITKKVYAEAITKEGVCSAKLGGSELESAVAAASELSDKVSVNNVRLFIPSYLGGATYYGAFVATSLTTANAKKGKTVSAYIRDLSGDVHFDGKTYRRLADATIGTQTLEDGRVTYKVSVPQQDVRAEISSMAQGEGLTIGMETLPGQKYTLQYRELLDSGEWADVMTFEGDGQFHEFTVEMSGSSGFYRVVVGD